MDWIEISANSLEKAKIDASVRLGVATEDIEVVVLENRDGLLSRILHHSIRIRARIKPLDTSLTYRKNRGTKRNLTDKDNRGKKGTRQPSKQDNAVKNKEIAKDGKPNGNTKKANDRNRNSPRNSSQRKVDRSGSANRKVTTKDNTTKENTMNNDTNENRLTKDNITETSGVPIKEQAEQISKFLSGLSNIMGLKAQSRIVVEDDVYTVELIGDNLGVLIGHHGVVFNAVQDVSRMVVRAASNQPSTGILIDIANYRSKRTAAITNFAVKQAQRVLETQKQVVLEHMDSAERKIVHEAVKTIDGVSTSSEGVEPNRVVIIFADSAEDSNAEDSNATSEDFGSTK